MLRDILQWLFHIICKFFVDLITENIRRLADDDGLYISISFFIERLIFTSKILRPIVFLFLLFLRRRQLLDDLLDRRRCAEDIGNILEKEIGKESSLFQKNGLK